MNSQLPDTWPIISPRYELSDIFREHGKPYMEKHPLPAYFIHVIDQIIGCRTADMGGHVEECDECGFQQISYNSCGNRHCPKCRTINKEKWIQDRRDELLPVGYFHEVFTLPHELNPLILCNMKVMLAILFSSVSETLQAFAADPKWRLNGQPGFIGIIHTWTQTLMDHFYLHCVVPGGVLSFDKSKFNPARKNFLFKTKSLSKEFRKRYIDKLRDAYKKNELIFPGSTVVFSTPDGLNQLIGSLLKKEWIVYSKKPFAGPEQVIGYLSRYTHRVALSNNRIKSIDNGKVTFSYRDRSDDNQLKEMTLDAEEFIRRFLLHILPKGFKKIRYFGFMFNRDKKKNVILIRKLLDSDLQTIYSKKETLQEIMLRLTGMDIMLCPICGKGRLRRISEIPGIRNGIYCNPP